MKYAVQGTLSVDVGTIIEADSEEQARAIANDLQPEFDHQLNYGDSKDGWVILDGASVDVDEIEEGGKLP